MKFLNLATFASLASFAPAQDVLLDVKSPGSGAQAVVGIAIGDWDGDGIGDLAIGADRDGTAGTDAGAVRVHSGRDGSVLATLYGESAGDLFGHPLVPMPDLDGDGFDDLAVTAIFASYSGSFTGAIYLVSGRSMTILRRIDGPAGAAYFGAWLGSLGDVDGDGVCDVFASDEGGSGAVHVFSGADGHEITVVNGSTGDAVAPACALDDLDGDGVRELLVGAPSHFDASGLSVGAVFVVSTATGAVLREQDGTYDHEYFGSIVAALGDLDGDGVRDYVVGEPVPGNVDHRFFVCSGATGVQLAQIVAPTNQQPLSREIVDAGDVNRDGIDDIAITGSWTDSIGSDRGCVQLVSGRSFQFLDRIETRSADILSEVSTFAHFDLDQDGFEDVIIGEWGLGGPYLDGEVRVFSGNDLWLNCTTSQPSKGTTLDLTTREGTPGALTILVVEDVDGAPTFQIVGGITTFDSTGGNTYSATVPAGLAGHQVGLRAYAHDASGRVIESSTQSITFK